MKTSLIKSLALTLIATMAHNFASAGSTTRRSQEVAREDEYTNQSIWDLEDKANSTPELLVPIKVESENMGPSLTNKQVSCLKKQLASLTNQEVQKKLKAIGLQRILLNIKDLTRDWELVEEELFFPEVEDITLVEGTDLPKQEIATFTILDIITSESKQKSKSYKIKYSVRKHVSAEDKYVYSGSPPKIESMVIQHSPDDKDPLELVAYWIQGEIISKNKGLNRTNTELDWRYSSYATLHPNSEWDANPDQHWDGKFPVSVVVNRLFLNTKNIDYKALVFDSKIRLARLGGCQPMNPDEYIDYAIRKYTIDNSANKNQQANAQAPQRRASTRR